VLIIPAIDLREGHVVRLVQGDYARQTTYSRDPVATARWLVEQGARRVHVVDLDAARGLPHHGSHEAMGAVVDTLASLDAECEVGGGIRSDEVARSWLTRGAAAVVIGSLALRQPDRARAICEANPQRVLLGLDVRGSEARAQGWTESGGTAAAHVRRWRDWPVAGIIHTDTMRDGMMTGPDIDGLRTLHEAYPGPVFASGGIGSLDDIAACAAAGASAVVMGKALYEGTVDLAAAVLRFSPEGAG
jgi:phosphoribosylformimino-5-aminoimidazole carboxamide ribotide isomerase